MANGKVGSGRVGAGRVCIAASLVAWLSWGAAWAPGGADPDAPGLPGPKSRSYPDLPPSPPSVDFVTKAVMTRFPGVSSDAVLKFIDEHFAEEMGEVKNLSETSPDRAVERLTDMIQESLDLMRTKARDAALFDKMIEEKRLEKASRRWAEAVKRSTGAEKSKRLDELRKTVTKAFDVRQELMKLDIAQMEKDIAHLKVLLDRREGQREAIISRRLTELTDETGDLW